MMELRMTSVLVWIALSIILVPAVYRVVWRGGSTPLEKVLAVTWFLALNRLCFGYVNLVTPGDTASLGFCQASGAAAGLAMCFVAHAALKGQRR